MARNPALLDVAERLRGRSALAALVSTLLLFGLFYDGAGLRLDRQDDLVVLKYVVLCIVRMVMVWSCLLTCVGYAARYLQRQSVVIEFLNESVYPLFILHLTIMTAIGFFVVQWHVDLWLKYLVITTATFALVLVIFHCLIRPFDAMRFLFGVKPKQWKGD